MTIGRGEATKTRIREAASAEFADYGFAGARVERIAAAAKCNKNLIYVYFGSKEALFAAVIEENTARIVEALPFTPDDLAGFAARAFDYTMANPASMRLVARFTLEQGLENPSSRVDVLAEQRRQIGLAQERGTVTSAFPPGFILTAVVVLAAGWSAASPFGSAMDPDALADQDALRAMVAAAVDRIASTPGPISTSAA